MPHVNESELTVLNSFAALYLDIVSEYLKDFVQLGHYFLLLSSFIKCLESEIFKGLSYLHDLYLQSNWVSFVSRRLFNDLDLAQCLHL